MSQKYRSVLIWVGFFALLPQSLHAQKEAVIESRAHYQKSIAAYRAHDYEAFREHTREAARLRPGHAGLLYNLAGGNALTGEADEALTLLRKYAAMGLFAAPQDDVDFASIHDAEGFGEILARLEANNQPLVKSEVAFGLPDPAFVPEGIAFDPETGDFYVGSVYQRRIMRLTASGEVHEVASAADGLWSVLGIAVDAERRRLWAASAGMVQTPGLQPKQQGQTALFLFDLETDKLVDTYFVQADSNAHALGDLTVHTSGDVFTTDGLDGAVFVLRNGARQLEALVPPQTLLSPQGICFTDPDGPLYLADYALGVLTVDPQSGEKALMESPADAALLGIDGLACHGSDLIVIQNGVRPHRVLRLRLNTTGDAIVQAETLEANHPTYEEPTLGVVVGDDFYYVANSQWNRFDANGNLPSSGLRAPIILKLPLD